MDLSVEQLTKSGTDNECSGDKNDPPLSKFGRHTSLYRNTNL